MNINQAKIVVREWTKNPAYPPLILVGGAGIGKTQTVTDVCNELKLHMETIRIGSLDSPGDLLGLPETKDGVTVFTEIDTFKRLREGGTLFLDELNRCKPVLMDSIMQILDQKRLASYDLTKCTVIGAMNPDTDDYNVTSMDNAVIDRCLFIKVDNSLDEVVRYLKHTDADPAVVELALLGEKDLKCSDAFGLPIKEFKPRGLRQLQTILPIISDNGNGLHEDARHELITACVGPKGQATWINRDLLKSIPNASEFIANAEKYKVENWDHLAKNVMLHRIDKFLETNTTAIKNKAKFTEQMARFGEHHLAYIYRTTKHITSKLDQSNSALAAVSNTVIKATQRR